MTKRQRIVITSIISAALVFAVLMTGYISVAAELLLVMGAVYLLSSWSLQPDLTRIEYLTLLALPTLLTAATILTVDIPDLPNPGKYLIPPIYGAIIYATLLTENIFNVAAERQIPLLRAARTVGYLLTLAVSFFITTLLFSRHLPSYFNASIMAVVGAAAVGQALWQVGLTATNRRKLLLASLVSALSVGELALVISFWPVHPLGAGIAITTLIYFLVGMIQHDWQENLTRRTLIEYTLVSLAVLMVLFFATSWGG